MHIAASLRWLPAVQNATTWPDLLAQSQSSDAIMALALCQLYFPELTEPVNRYIQAQVSCYQHAVASYVKSGKTGTVGAIAMMTSGYMEKIDALFAAKNDLEALITMSAGLYA